MIFSALINDFKDKALTYSVKVRKDRENGTLMAKTLNQKHFSFNQLTIWMLVEIRIVECFHLVNSILDRWKSFLLLVSL